MSTPDLNSPLSSDSMTSLAWEIARPLNTSMAGIRLTAREPSLFYENSSAPSRPAGQADSVVLDCKGRSTSACSSTTLAMEKESKYEPNHGSTSWTETATGPGHCSACTSCRLFRQAGHDDVRSSPAAGPA